MFTFTPESVFTFDQNRCSRCARISVHVRPEYAEKLKHEIKTLKTVIETNLDNNDINNIHDKKYSEEDNPTLTDLFKKWFEIHKESMKPSSFGEFNRMIDLFIRIINDKNSKETKIAELDVAAIRHYKELLEKIPKGVKAQKKSIAELAALSGQPKSKSTIKNILVNVGQFILWAKQQGYPVNDQIHYVLTSFPKTKSDQKKRRLPFDNSDLKKLFNSEHYEKGLFKRESEYWAPLIALFTGALESEILQLHVNDVCEVSTNKTYIFDINSNSEDKSLKVDGDTDGYGRPRLIPVHPKLVQLKFLEFVKHQKDSGLIRLFPSENRNTRGQFHAYSTRFRRYRDKVGAGPRNDKEFRDFHSFRHLIKTRLSDLEHHDGLIDDILGHSSSSRSSVGQGYSHADRLDLKLKALKKVRFDCIDFSVIKDWNCCEFSRV